MLTDKYDSVNAVEWCDGALKLLDQRLLPKSSEYIICHSASEVSHAISDMVVRGAPAIGISAAYGVVLAARDRYAQDPTRWQQAIEADLDALAAARPTAVNLVWAIEKMRRLIKDIDGDPVEPLLAAAKCIHQEDIAANRKMGELGSALIKERCAVLTHCNAGALATGGYGTALGVIRSACAAGLISQVYADETRPWLQGARLTAWELIQDGIPVTLLAEGAAGHLMKQGEVKWLIVGSDRIAANGDVANKIGTYNAAVLARYHGVKVMVVAPSSTIDMNTASGDTIPIELRAGDELLMFSDHRVAAPGAEAWNPVFDVTPASLVDAIVTEKGVVLAPTAEKMAAMMAS